MNVRTLVTLSLLAVGLPLACSAASDNRQFGAGAAGAGAGAAGSGVTGTGGAGGVVVVATTGSTGGGTPAGMEKCDQLDNNSNTLVDEGCPCNLGQSQPCWSGAPSRRGKGICRDGAQVCEQFGEFASWGPCLGQVFPKTEIPGNGIDEDCDGDDPGGGCMPTQEDCTNGKDDDCDGLVDCADPDCASQCSQCAPKETNCTDGKDDDCDGLVDCDDPDCAATTTCAPPPPPPGCVPEFPFFVELFCGDGKDNDCDGLIDCADPDCKRPGSCGCALTESNCSDGVDEDCDGQTDCKDVDCQLCAPGASRWCDDPVYCHWGKQSCGPDGHWGTCTEVTQKPTGCTGVIYNAQCCVQAGQCCQDYPNSQDSLGNCAGIVTCQ